MWSMNFVSDALLDGRRLQVLTVVDAFTCEAPAIDVDQGIKGEQVVKATITDFLDTPRAQDHSRGQCVGMYLEGARWAYKNGVTLDFSRPGKPTDDAFVRSFNNRLARMLERELVPVHHQRSSYDRRLTAGLY